MEKKEEMLKFAQNYLTEERREKYEVLMTDQKHSKFQKSLEAYEPKALYTMATMLTGGEIKEGEEEKTENFVIHLCVELEEKLTKKVRIQLDEETSVELDQNSISNC